MSKLLKHRVSRTFTVGALTLALLAPSYAWAAPPTHTPTQEDMSEARRRYDRALELSDEGNYDEALLELQRAYALAPTYRLLYNLGVVSVAVHDYVKAMDYFNRYLTEGGSEIEPARVTEVQQQIERLRTRVARIRVYTNVPSADISVDDVPVGKSPIDAPLTINSGRHRVSATLPGYLVATTVVELAGNDSRALSLNLVPATSGEKASKPFPWLAWGITGVLAAGTTVTGILALSAESKYDDKANTLGASGSDVASSYRTMRALSITTDVLLVGTVIAAGVSVYLTVKPAKQSKPTHGFLVTPNGIAF